MYGASPRRQDTTNMLRLCKELLALIEWEAEGFECSTRSEIDAAERRALRMEELLEQMREMARQD